MTACPVPPQSSRRSSERPMGGIRGQKLRLAGHQQVWLLRAAHTWAPFSRTAWGCLLTGTKIARLPGNDNPAIHRQSQGFYDVHHEMRTMPRAHSESSDRTRTRDERRHVATTARSKGGILKALIRITAMGDNRSGACPTSRAKPSLASRIQRFGGPRGNPVRLNPSPVHLIQCR